MFELGISTPDGGVCSGNGATFDQVSLISFRLGVVEKGGSRLEGFFDSCLGPCCAAVTGVC